MAPVSADVSISSSHLVACERSPSRSSRSSPSHAAAMLARPRSCCQSWRASPSTARPPLCRLVRAHSSARRQSALRRLRRGPGDRLPGPRACPQWPRRWCEQGHGARRRHDVDQREGGGSHRRRVHRRHVTAAKDTVSTLPQDFVPNLLNVPLGPTVVFAFVGGVAHNVIFDRSTTGAPADIQIAPNVFTAGWAARSADAT